MPESTLRIDQLFAIFFSLLILLLTGGLAVAQQPTPVSKPGSIRLVKPAPYVQQVATASTDVLQQASFNLTASAAAHRANYDSSLLFKSPVLKIEEISAQSYIVVDVNSAQILAYKTPNQQQYPASTVKLMTALVARDIYKLDQVLQVKNKTLPQGHKIGFKHGEKLLVRDLLTATLVNSGNDAAIILANHHPDGFIGFVQAMNDKAKTLNLSKTYFTNPSGLDHPSQQTTVWDLSLITREVLKDPFLRNLVDIQQTKITDINAQSEYQLFNTNQLLTQYEQVHGVKTGTTDSAGQVLITLWEQERHPVLIVIMNSENRYQDTHLIIDWIKNGLVWTQL